ncbi:hypothetical protein LTR08_004373 [Meristemomyces frigidus]|nr:hypothetical protein LTR08_004373 [Meristemomyces frigidus]
MRITQTSSQKTKAYLHFAQALCIFIAACLGLAILITGDGDATVGGQVGFYFAMCFLSIPALIYQVMVPMWTRAWRFANSYAYASLDLLFTVLWFAAFIALAVWNRAGLKAGELSLGKRASSGGSCANFAYGTATTCGVAKAGITFGVLICILFVVTSILSVKAAMEYRRTGVMPGGNTIRPQKTDVEDAWSVNVDEVDYNYTRPSSDPFGDHNNASSATMPTYGQLSQHDVGDISTAYHGHDHQGYSNSNTSPDNEVENWAVGGGSPHPGKPTSFGSADRVPVAGPAYDEALAPSALSPTGGYGAQSAGGSGRVEFPEGRYDMDPR